MLAKILTLPLKKCCAHMLATLLQHYLLSCMLLASLLFTIQPHVYFHVSHSLQLFQALLILHVCYTFLLRLFISCLLLRLTPFPCMLQLTFNGYSNLYSCLACLLHLFCTCHLHVHSHVLHFCFACLYSTLQPILAPTFTYLACLLHLYLVPFNLMTTLMSDASFLHFCLAPHKLANLHY